MDDYNTDVLSQAKNEYSLSLVNTIVPLIIEGIFGKVVGIDGVLNLYLKKH